MLLYLFKQASSFAKRFIPLMDRVLVQKVKPTVQTKSGLFLPDSAKGSSNLAKVQRNDLHIECVYLFIPVFMLYPQVLSVGAGRLNRDGVRVPIDLKEGDTVMVPEYGGMPLKLDDEEFHVFRDEDIIGILKDN